MFLNYLKSIRRGLLRLGAGTASIIMKRGLDGCHYRIGLGPGFFLAAGVISLSVALLTAGALSLEAALFDPVKAIRYE